MVELLVVMVMLGFIVGGLVLSGSSAQRLGLREREVSQSMRDAQTAALKMTRELRQATQILPAGNATGQCPAGTSASCVEFLVRTRTINATTLNHGLMRVRIDCRVAYTLNPNDPYAGTYRSCVRYASVDTSVPPTTSTAVLVPRILNWTVNTCNAKDATFTCPVFNYRTTDVTQANGWAVASTFTAAQRIDVSLQIPARGEATRAGTSRALLVQDSAQLRNLL